MTARIYGADRKRKRTDRSCRQLIIISDKFVWKTSVDGLTDAIFIDK